MNIEPLRNVVVERLSVQYGRANLALNEVDFTIDAGLFGLLGPNGAGKTTLMRTLATLQSPTRGGAKVLGFDIHRDPRQVRRMLGYRLGGNGTRTRTIRGWDLDRNEVLSGRPGSIHRRRTTRRPLGRHLSLRFAEAPKGSGGDATVNEPQ